MQLNAGIVTDKLQESKSFYQKALGFGVSFENDFYLLMHTPDKKYEISFLQSNHPSQAPIFHEPYAGKGMFLTIEMDDVDGLYESIKSKNIPIAVPIRDEDWGDRHFSIVDPNGIGIDLVRYQKPDAED